VTRGDEFLEALPELAMNAFQDLSNRTNPRMPLVSEITDLLKLGYYGTGDQVG
jgi:acetaldehyde dehydrogenase/alcohol dehydrogenase